MIGIVNERARDRAVICGVVGGCDNSSLDEWGWFV